MKHRRIAENKPSGILHDGNPHKIPRMGTLSGIGHPSLPPAYAQWRPDRPLSRGTGPRSLSERYAGVDRSIDSGVPFGKGMGVFLRAVALEHLWHPVGEVPMAGRKGDFSCVGMQEPGFVESPVRRDRDTDHDRDTDMVVTAERHRRPPDPGSRECGWSRHWSTRAAGPASSQSR